MNSYYIEVRYTLEGVRREALDQHSDAMMDALLVEPSLTDPDVGVNFGIGTVDVCVGVAAEDDPTALRIALVAIRSALHHVGPGTPAESGPPRWSNFDRGPMATRFATRRS